MKPTVHLAVARQYGVLAWWADKLRQEPDYRQKNSAYSLLTSYAYVVPRYQAEFNEYLQHAAKATAGQDLRLTTREMLRADTWFFLHPEKVCGREEITTSQQFPLTVVGTQDDIIRTIRAGMRTPATSPNLALMKLKAKALNIKLKLQAQRAANLRGLGLNGFAGLAGLLAGPGLAGLGDVSPATASAVTSSELAIRAILEQAQQERKYNERDALSFEEVLRLYNPGISDEDIRAWVWFRRSIGVPMGGGWKKFYLRETGEKSRLLVTTKATAVLDNAWRPIATVPAGMTLGKDTRKSHEYQGITYRIFRSEDNAIRFVDDAAVKNQEGVASSSADLDRLVKAGALFYSDGELLPYPVYAFGNMYDRELQLRADKDALVARYGEAVYDAHETVIKTVRPRMLSIQNPDSRERPKILSISEFAKQFYVRELREDVLDVEAVSSDATDPAGNKVVSLHHLFREWLRVLPPTEKKEVALGDILRYYVDARPLSKDLNDSEKQTIEMFGPIEGEELFTRFLYECLTFDDQQKLDFTWNRTYNAFSSVPYHRVPVGFECSALFKRGLLQFTPAQREAIAFVETTGSGILAYDVGVGKTMASIITLANALYAGKCKRPVVVVPNPTYKKWVREIIGYEDNATGEFIPGVLSNTGLTVNEWYNLGADVPAAKQLAAGKLRVPERSITVLTYEGLMKMGLSRKMQEVMFDELAAILAQGNDNDREETGRGKKKSARDAEKRFQRYRELVGGAQSGTICDIDALGFDYLVVDEAHNYKNIFGQVPTDDEGKKRFNISGSESARGQKLFFLANYLQRRHGRNVLLLTATPFTNSPLEIYSMLSLVGYETMVRMGLHNLEQFCETFVLQSAEYVNSYDNQVKLAPVVKRFNNRLILQKLIFNHIAYKTGEEAGVQRPCKVNLPRTTTSRDGKIERLGRDQQVLTYLEMSDGQFQNQEDIIDSLRHRDPKDFGAIMRALGQSLDNALSPHLVKGYGEPEDYRDYIRQSPKLQYVMQCIASVKEWHESRNTPVSGQVIYMNRGKDYFPLIREWLLKEVGYQAEVKFNGRKFCEVEIISSGLSAEKKEAIKDAFLAGVVKIIIGTATIREGIDLQTKGTTLYNCYPDWNPTDVKQLEGRIWRQGNEFGFVRVVMPLVQNSMDVFVFQKLEEKTSRVNDLWYRGDRGNVLDQESLDPEEVKFALFTDIEQLLRIELDRQIKDVQRRLSVGQADLQALTEYSANRTKYNAARTSCLTMLSTQAKAPMSAYYPTLFSFATDATMPYSRPIWWNVMTAKQRDEFRTDVQEWLVGVQAFQEGSNQDDRDLLSLGREMGRLQSKQGQAVVAAWGELRALVSKMRKAEKTFAANRGADVAADPETARTAVLVEIDRLRQEEKYYREDTEYHAKLRAEVLAKKERLAITGGTVEDRVREFARLNHLLGIRAGARATCDIPAAPRELPAAPVRKLLPAPRPAAPAANLQLLKLKAKALKIKLKLQAQATQTA